MSSTCHVPSTPSRKRAASGSEPNLYEVPIKIERYPERPSTPVLHDVPELSRDNSPEAEDHSPRTPSPTTRPSQVLPADQEVEKTPTRPSLRPRKPKRANVHADSQPLLQASAESCSFKVSKDDRKQGLLFAQVLYPVFPPLDDTFDNKDEFKADDFDFARLAEDSPRRARAAKAYMPCLQRRCVQKKVRERDSLYENPSENDIVTPINSQIVETKIDEAHGRLDLASQDGGTVSRFLRILPCNPLERLHEDPARCIASLVTRPNERCSQRKRTSGDVKSKILAKLATLESPSNLDSSQSYVRELVGAVTCTKHHFEIATKQLERLLKRYHDSGTREFYGDYEFKLKDMGVLDSWLQAWTSLPEGIDRVDRGQRTETRATIVWQSKPVISLLQKVTSPIPMKPPRAAFSGQASAIEVRTITTVKKLEIAEPAVAESGKLPKSSQVTVEATQILRSSETVQTVQTVQVIYTPDQVDVVTTESVVKASESIGPIQCTETTKNTTPIQTPVSDGHTLENRKAVVTTQVTKATKTMEVKENLARNATIVALVEQDRTVQNKFDPTQYSKFVFAIAEAGCSPQKLKPQVGRPKIPAVNLQQTFSWFHYNLYKSVESHLYKRLHERVTGKEWETGLIYMYWITGNFGFVKIGKTSGISTARRLNEWRKQCGHKIEEHKHGEDAQAIQLPFVYRVEALVHEELREARLRENGCKVCKVWHKEWFLVSPDHAQKVIKKWSDWMLTRPYDEDGTLKKSITQEEINALCQPIKSSPAFAAPAPTPPKGQGQQKSRGARERGDGTVWTGRLRPRKTSGG